MILGIVGTRHEHVLPTLLMEMIRIDINQIETWAEERVTEIESGECPTGIDQIAKRYAKEHGIPFRGFPPSAETADALIAFPCQHSTWVTVRYFEDRGLRAIIHRISCRRRKR